MKIVTIEELRKMPIGTVFCEMDEWCNFREDFRIITDRNPLTGGFSGTLPLYPWIEENDRTSLFARKENEEWLPQNKDHVITGKEVPCEWITVDETDFEHNKNEIFAVFNKDEVKEMIECLQWALKGDKEETPIESIRLGFEVGIDKSENGYAVSYIADGEWHEFENEENLTLTEDKATELAEKIKSLIDDFMEENGVKFHEED